MTTYADKAKADRLARIETAGEMHRAGKTRDEICAAMGLGRKAVSEYLRADATPSQPVIQDVSSRPGVRTYDARRFDHGGLNAATTPVSLPSEPWALQGATP